MDWLRPKALGLAGCAWALCFGGAAALCSVLFYVFFRLKADSDFEYAWASVFYHDDYFQYYAWARHIAAGEWLIRNYYTSDPSASFALFNPYFLGLGWLTRAAGNVYFATHALRAANVMLYAWVSYAFIALFLPRFRERAAAHLLALGGGMEHPWALLGGARPPSPLADPYVFKMMYRDGHLMFALALLLAAFGTYLVSARRAAAGERRPIWKDGAALFALVLMLALVNPYYLALAALVFGAHGLGLAAWGQWHGLKLALFAGAASAIAAAQYAVQPVTRRLGAIAFDDPVGPLDLALFFTVAAPLAAAGWMEARRMPPAVQSEGAAPPRWELGQGFLMLWGALVFLAALSPLAFRARLTFGMSLVLAIPAAAWLMNQRSRWPYAAAAAALLLVEPAFTLVREFMEFHAEKIGQLDNNLMRALRFLDGRAEVGDVVLVGGDTGNYVPAYTLASTVVGHSFQTPHFEETQRRVNRYFADAGTGENQEFLESSGVRFILAGPFEKGLAQSERPVSDWPAVYDAGGWTVYERPATSRSAK